MTRRAQATVWLIGSCNRFYSSTQTRSFFLVSAIFETRKEWTYIFVNAYVQIHDTHICTHIYIYETNVITKQRARKSFVTRSFLFNKQKKSFHDRVISLVRQIIQKLILHKILDMYPLIWFMDKGLSIVQKLHVWCD